MAGPVAWAWRSPMLELVKPQWRPPALPDGHGSGEKTHSFGKIMADLWRLLMVIYMED